MRTASPDLTNLRRSQIVEAAVAIITEQGLQNLSLSEIETRAGMSRGQLTYYFPAKEDILLAVFDRLVELMHQRMQTSEDQVCVRGRWTEVVAHLLDRLMAQPPCNPEFGCLQHTFLAQIGHRDDFRQRLASLYEEWRDSLAEHLARELTERAPVRPVSARALATVVQAIFHGVVTQSVTDPDAFDRAEVKRLCLDMLTTYLWGDRPRKKRRATPRKMRVTNGKAVRSLP